MHPGDPRRPRRRRARIALIVTASVVVLLAGLAAAGLFAFRYVNGLASDASFDYASENGLPEGPVDAVVETRDLAATVAATGALASAKPLTLGFPGPGEVTELTVAVGDTVTAGQVLARQDPRVAQLDLETAEAALAAAERAAGLRGPATDVAQRSREARVAEARVTVDAATSALENTKAVADANAVALQSAVDASQRQLDRDAAAVSAAQAIVAETQAAEPAPAMVHAADAELAAARTAAAGARSTEVDAAGGLAVATASGDGAAVATAQATLDAATAASAAVAARVGDAQAAVEANTAARGATSEARATAAAADTALAVANDALVNARDTRRGGLAADAQTVDAARSAAAQSKAALQVLVTGEAAEAAGGSESGAAAGTSPEELRVAVQRAELEVERARTALERLTIVAPVAATVTKVNATVGATLGDVTAGAAGSGGSDAATPGPSDVITLATAQQLVAEIKVPETEAIKLEAGMPVELKFSALPDVIGSGKVLTVLPTDTGSTDAANAAAFDPYAAPGDGGAQKTYTVTMSIDDPPAGARGGLTIAARVVIGEQRDVLAVPTAALAEFEDTTVVQRLTADGSTEEVAVETGLRQGGYTEVVSGLAAGDEVRIDGGGTGEFGGADVVEGEG